MTKFGKDPFIRMLAIIVPMVFISSALAESGHDCKSFQLSQNVKSPCYWVSGKLFMYNGWPPNTRLALTGTKQVYGVGPGAEGGLMPSYLEEALVKSKSTEVRGEFEVCPFGGYFVDGDQSVINKSVCIQRAKNLYFWGTPKNLPESARWIAFPVPEHFSFVGYPIKQY